MSSKINFCLDHREIVIQTLAQWIVINLTSDSSTGFKSSCCGDCRRNLNKVGFRELRKDPGYHVSASWSEMWLVCIKFTCFKRKKALRSVLPTRILVTCLHTTTNLPYNLFFVSRCKLILSFLQISRLVNQIPFIRLELESSQSKYFAKSLNHEPLSFTSI